MITTGLPLKHFRLCLIIRNYLFGHRSEKGRRISPFSTTRRFISISLNFNVTAATIAELDLVMLIPRWLIYWCDKPVWILLYARLALDERRQSLLGTKVLFRQNDPGDWRSVVNDVDNALSRSF